MLAFLCLLRILEGIICRRVLGQSGNQGTFRQIQLADRLVEIGLCRRLYAIGILAEVNDIHIQLKDGFLAVNLFLQRQGAHDFRHLALDGIIVIICHVFDQLLGDGGAAVAAAAGKNPVQRRTHGTFPVHALVLIEAFVLNRNKCIRQILRYVIHIDPFTVFLAGKLLQNLLIAAVIVVINDAVEFHRKTADIQISLRHNYQIQIRNKCAKAYGCGCQTDEKQR